MTQPRQARLSWLMGATAVAAVVLMVARFVANHFRIVASGFYLVGLPGVLYLWVLMRVVIPRASKARRGWEGDATPSPRLQVACEDAVFWAIRVSTAAVFFGLVYYPALFAVLSWFRP